jgi:predicted nucleic acid-binding protein
LKIYLDVCCLNRPFDSGSQSRIANEAAAVVRLLDLVESSRLSDYSSEMAQIEIERVSDPERRKNVLALLPPADRIIPLSDDLLDAAESLADLGFGVADAVHIAAARKIGVDAFLTVDDRLLNRAKRYTRELGVRVINPVSFIREVERDIDR